MPLGEEAELKGDEDIQGNDENKADNSITDYTLLDTGPKENSWYQWGATIKEEVLLLMKSCKGKKSNDNGSEVNGYRFPALVERLILDISHIPLWTGITYHKYQHGRLPASSASVVSEIKKVKRNIFRGEKTRPDGIVKKHLDYLHGRLIIVEDAMDGMENGSSHTENADIGGEEGQKSPISVHLSEEPNEESSQDFSGEPGRPKFAGNTDDSDEIIPETDVEGEYSTTGVNVQDSSDEMETPMKHHKYRFQTSPSIDRSSPSYSSLDPPSPRSSRPRPPNPPPSSHGNSSPQPRDPFASPSPPAEPTAHSSYMDDTSEPPSHIFSNTSFGESNLSTKPQCIACIAGQTPSAHHCIRCKKPVHLLNGCSVPIAGMPEGYGQSRLCLMCSLISPADTAEFVSQQHVENWGGLGIPGEKKSRGLYTSENGRKVKDLLNLPKSGGLPVLKNGSSMGLQPLKLDNNRLVTVIHTCPFDSTFQLLLAAASDYPSVHEWVSEPNFILFK